MVQVSHCVCNAVLFIKAPFPLTDPFQRYDGSLKHSSLSVRRYSAILCENMHSLKHRKAYNIQL